MIMRLQNRMRESITRWLNSEDTRKDVFLTDYESLEANLCPGDVILVEGRSRISKVIKNITLSSWTHAAIYVGRLNEVQDRTMRVNIREHFNGDLNEPLIIEALLGEGCIVAPLSRYRKFHLRLCRPINLLPEDTIKVLGHCISYLGHEYDIRQLFDLARFMFPCALLPRRWRSSLFNCQFSDTSRVVCSTLIGEAFQSVQYPVLPRIRIDKKTGQHLRRRNPRLYTPRDFDYSPYFEVIKFPVHHLNEPAVYRNLPWENNETIFRDENNELIPLGMKTSPPGN